jgi:hypothetical protein
LVLKRNRLIVVARGGTMMYPVSDPEAEDIGEHFTEEMVRVLGR